MQRQLSGERETVVYNSLTDQVPSTLGTLAICPALVAKLEFLLPLARKPAWALESGPWSVSSPWSSALRACHIAPLLLPPHHVPQCGPEPRILFHSVGRAMPGAVQLFVWKS